MTTVNYAIQNFIQNVRHGHSNQIYYSPILSGNLLIAASDHIITVLMNIATKQLYVCIDVKLFPFHS